MANDPRSKPGGHSLFDHSSFPDAEIVRVRGQNFFVSSSYLALHSPYFHNFFFGPRAAGQNGRFELDCDPRTFGDLLDIIYPCYKKTNCCVECTSTFEARMDLAIHLQLKFAERRLLQEDLSNESIGCQQHVTLNFPDAVTLTVKGLAMLVSATTLSLHSPLLKDLLYKNGELARDPSIDVDRKSFYSFMKATKGEFPAEPTTQFLDDLLKLGARQMYDFYLSEIGKKMCEMSSEEASNYAKILIEHYSKQPDPDQIKIRNASRFLSNDDMKIEQPINVNERNGVALVPDENRNGYNVFVKNLRCETTIVYCAHGARTTVEELKILYERLTGTPADQQRQVFAGKQLVDDCTFGDYNIVKDSVLHLVLRTRGC